VRLTKTAIASAKYEGGNRNFYAIWDDLVPGFGVRIHPSEKKVFILVYRIGKAKKFFNIGPTEVLTVQQARDRARRLLVDVKDGKDPQAEKKEKLKSKTVGDLIDAYMEDHAKIKKKSWLKDKKRLERHVRPKWKGRLVSSITFNDVDSLHRYIKKAKPKFTVAGKPRLDKDGNQIIRETPYEANRVVEILRKMFNLAAQWGYVPANHPNPAVGIQKFKEDKRDRFVTEREMPRLLRSIEDEPNIYIKAALLLYLLTGVRRNELLTARWEQVNFDNAELELRKTKTGKKRYVLLSIKAMEILKNIPKEKDNPFIFPGRHKDKPLVNIDDSWKRIKDEAGVSDVRIHDLRRTVGSWLASEGRSIELVGEVLGNESIEATKVYARFEKNVKQKAVEQHGRKLEEIMRGDQTKAVERFKEKYSVPIDLIERAIDSYKQRNVDDLERAAIELRDLADLGNNQKTQDEKSAHEAFSNLTNVLLRVLKLESQPVQKGSRRKSKTFDYKYESKKAIVFISDPIAREIIREIAANICALIDRKQEI